MILNSVIRAAEDVDILIEDSTENFCRVIEGLSHLAARAARELKPEDILPLNARFLTDCDTIANQLPTDST